MFDFQEELRKLPDQPGVYIMHDKTDAIIYIGKAVSLRKRVRQYFQPSHDEGIKKKQMVEHIARFEYIITDSELEALVLECNLIKEHRPHYNTMLTKDFPQYYLDCEETGAPELLWVASKSGSMNACRNDGGIVHTPYGEYVIVLMNKDFHDIIEYNDHPAIVYGARVSRMILDQVLACEGKLWLD